MAAKKKPVKRKKTAAAKRGGIAAYTRKIQNAPAVKRASTTIKTLEAKIKAAKKAKAAAVKAARKKIK